MTNDLIYRLARDIRTRNYETLQAILTELRTFHRPFLDNLVRTVAGGLHTKSVSLDSGFIVLLAAIISERLAGDEELAEREFHEIAQYAMDTFLCQVNCRPNQSLAWSSWEEFEADVHRSINGDFIRSGEIPSSPSKLTTENFITIGTLEWDKLTDRRAELIYKKNREGLKEEEQTEYQRLQQISQAAIARTFPYPKLESEEKVGDVEEKLGTVKDSTDR
jgi:hypothetical protein